MHTLHTWLGLGAQSCYVLELCIHLASCHQQHEFLEAPVRGSWPPFCMGMRADMCEGIRVDIHVYMCVYKGVDMCADMCVDMRRHICAPFASRANTSQGPPLLEGHLHSETYAQDLKCYLQGPIPMLSVDMCTFSCRY